MEICTMYNEDYQYVCDKCGYESTIEIHSPIHNDSVQEEYARDY